MALPLAELSAIVRRVLHDPDIQLEFESRFEDIPEWDSMYLITVVVEVECRCGLLFDPVDIEMLYTAGDLIRLVERRRALAAA